MDLGLQGHVAVVFAASRGLGLACATALAQEGCDLAICSRSQAAIQQAAEQIKAKTGRKVLWQVVDVVGPEQTEAFAVAVEREYGQVDILVNNSGGPPPGDFESLGEAQFRGACELLLMSAVRATKAFLPLIRKTQRGGRIITLTSTSVREVLANLMLSNSLRAAVLGWSKSLARELAGEKILVNCVAPGIVHTERIEELVAAAARKSGKTIDETRAAMESRIPLGRFGRPEEFAAAVTFLASARASFISGTTLYVDGAMMSSVV